MRYEKMRPLEEPFKLWTGPMPNFSKHRHADFELHYCFADCFAFCIDENIYRVNQGDLIVIPPMCAHALESRTERSRAFCAIFGLSFLGADMATVGALFSEVKIIKREAMSSEIIETLSQLIASIRKPSVAGHLMNTGNLYRLVGLLVESHADSPSEPYGKVSAKVESIERVLELIYSDYAREISVEEAAHVSGYSKSNFCKVFKTAVGFGFHSFLNRYRVKISMGLLSETTMQIADIATEVGFAESKTFCRVFKEINGISPLAYRKSAQ